VRGREEGRESSTVSLLLSDVLVGNFGVRAAVERCFILRHIASAIFYKYHKGNPFFGCFLL
jgi:hypothetical protein